MAEASKHVLGPDDLERLRPWRVGYRRPHGGWHEYDRFAHPEDADRALLRLQQDLPLGCSIEIVLFRA